MKNSSIQIHKVSGKDGDTFVGLILEKSKVHIYSPEAYPLDLESRTFSDDIISLFRTFNNSKWSDEKEEYPNKIANGPTFDAFESYIWVIKDYISNGVPLDHFCERKKNVGGKISWKRTIQSSNLIISDGNILYDPLISVRQYHSESLFSQIYRKCLNMSISYFGWLYHLETKEDFNIEETEKKQYLAYLKNRLLQTYTDYGKILILHLMKIVSGVSSLQKGDKLQFGVQEYHSIFERLVDYYFGNVSRIEDFYPGASWHLKKLDYSESKCSPLRPDTVVVNGVEAFVIDSKFYRYGSTALLNTLPDTSSIQKQITYGDFIKNNNLFGISIVYNVFLLPYDKTAKYYRDIELFESTDNIQFIGYAETEWRSGSTSHEIIYAFLIDLKYLIKQCLLRRKGQDSDFLINSVKEIQRDLFEPD